jgi:hypothetical protein
MPMPPRPKKKPAADISILMPEPDGDEPKGHDPKSQDDLGSSDDLDDSFGGDDDDLDLGEGDMGGDDPLAADGSTDIDPEQASLMADLGFSDPEQQQKLLDLIDLRIAKGPGAAPSPSLDSGSELPEGGY